MKELEKAGVPVSKIIEPYKLTPIKLVDDGSTDYDSTGEYSPMRQDTEAIDTEEILMDVPDRVNEQYGKRCIGRSIPITK